MAKSKKRAMTKKENKGRVEQKATAREQLSEEALDKVAGGIAWGGPTKVQSSSITEIGMPITTILDPTSIKQ